MTTITKSDREHYKNTILSKFPKCKLSMYLERVERTNKYMKYASVSSKNQFATLMSNNNTKEYITIHNNLLTLISKFITSKNYIQDIEKILKLSNDEKIYNEIAKYSKPTHSSDKIITSIKDLPSHRCGRDIMQAEDVVYHIKEYINPNTNITYLDIGCGSCLKTKYIGELLDLSLDNIYGADIDSWFTYSDKNRITEELSIKFISLEIDKPLPIETNKFNLITALYMLHHVKNLDIMLSELNRILKLGGYLFIAEHDAPTLSDKMLCDIEHGLFAVVIDKDDKYYNTYYAKYYDWIDWDLLLTRFGFKYIKADYVFDVNFNINPTRKFYAIYKKIEEYK